MDKKTSPAEVKIPIKMCFCECKWKMFRQMEQHRGSTSPCCSCRAKSVQHSWNDRKDDEPLNHFSSHKEKKPQNPVSADWLLLFPLGCRAAEANQFRRDESGKTAALIPQTGQTINLPCFLHDVDCTDQKLGYGEPLWNFDAIILSVTHRFLFQCLAVTLVASPAGDLEASRVGLLVNQYVWLTSEEKETAFAS